MSDTPDEPTAPLTGGDPAPGAVLGGRYELRTVLGRGGMATVWRAHDPVLHRDVAIKIFLPSSALPDASARAAAEVRMLAGLNHPHLVSVYDAAASAPGSFDHLVMELVEGRSLRERLDAGPLPADEVARLGAELATGLEYVHERGIVHRDLKPANVLLERTSRGDRAKIADFGVARLLEGVALTMAGTTVGTANYLSPEQATGVDAGPPSDVYSLGLVLLECLTGVMAYPGHGVGAAAARLHRPPEIPPALGPAWTDLLAAMTALDPRERPDAVQVAARLRRLEAAGDPSTQILPAAESPAGTAVLPAAAPPIGTAVLPVAPTRRRRRGLLVAIGVVAAAIIGLGLILGFGGGSDAGGPAQVPSAPVSTAPRTGTPATTAPPTSTAPATSAPVTSAPATTARPSSTAPAGPPAPAPPGQNDPGKTKKSNPGKGHDKP